jgi:uncharacterized protein (TIGR03086 family)
MDLVDLYRRSLYAFATRAAEVHPEQWSAPTPCADWDVRTLVNHVVGEQLWSVPLLEGATVPEVGDRFDGDLLGNDPAGAARSAATQAAGAVDAPNVLERTVHLSFGDFPGAEYLSQLLADHLIHGWDLAVAIGADPTLDPDAVTAVAGWFADREQMYREGGAIGPRLELPANAQPGDRLLAAFGRDPDWEPARLV